MTDFIRCLKCDGRLLPSGVEVHRLVCQTCGQNYHAVLQFIPVEPICRNKELDADRRSTPNGGGEVSTPIR